MAPSSKGLRWAVFAVQGLAITSLLPAQMTWGLSNTDLLIWVMGAFVLGLVFQGSNAHQIQSLFPFGGGGYRATNKFLGSIPGMMWGVCNIVQQIALLASLALAGALALESWMWIPSFSSHWIAGLLVVMLMAPRLHLVQGPSGWLPLVALGIFVCGVLGLLGSGFSKIHFPLPETTGLGGGLFWYVLALSSVAWSGLGGIGHVLADRSKPQLLQAGLGLASFLGVNILLFLGLALLFAQCEKIDALSPWASLASWAGLGSWYAAVLGGAQALLLLVAARETFAKGSRTLAGLAVDGWMPRRFALLSGRLVTQNSVFLFGIAAIALLFAGLSLRFMLSLLALAVLANSALNHFALAYYWMGRRKRGMSWFFKISLNVLGLCFALVLMAGLAWFDWLSVVGAVAAIGIVSGVAYVVWANYRRTQAALERVDKLCESAFLEIGRYDPSTLPPLPEYAAVKRAPTAVLIVDGFDGVGIHTFLTISRLFHGHYQNFIVVQVGLLDAGNYKSQEELESMRSKVQKDLENYHKLMHGYGHYCEVHGGVGTDTLDEVERQVSLVLQRFPRAVAFTGSMLFKKESMLTQLLHNEQCFALEKRLHYLGIPLLILPVRVDL